MDMANYNKTWNFAGYEYIGVTNGVCGNRPIVLGTTIEPHQVVEYGKPEKVMEDLGITLEQIEECYWFTNY